MTGDPLQHDVVFYSSLISLLVRYDRFKLHNASIKPLELPELSKLQKYYTYKCEKMY